MGNAISREEVKMNIQWIFVVESGEKRPKGRPSCL
jgi:hypothetical protein